MEMQITKADFKDLMIQQIRLKLRIHKLENRRTKTLGWMLNTDITFKGLNKNPRPLQTNKLNPKIWNKKYNVLCVFRAMSLLKFWMTYSHIHKCMRAFHHHITTFHMYSLGPKYMAWYINDLKPGRITSLPRFISVISNSKVCETLFSWSVDNLSDKSATRGERHVPWGR